MYFEFEKEYHSKNWIGIYHSEVLNFLMKIVKIVKILI